MKSKAVIIIGGSGYIGRNLLSGLIERNRFDQYFIMDIRPLVGFENEEQLGLVKYINADVRSELPDLPDNGFDGRKSWIFNLAAIHREPGHNFRDYFDTNTPGAQNVNALATRLNIKNIFFTSSIAPYGRSQEQSTEASNLYPETGYGISKALAEKEHQNWLNKDVGRRLVIVRPSVIYGPHDPGNVYRMIKALKKGTFILPNGGKVIKAYGYVYGLVESMLFTMDERKEPLIVYNYAENPLVPLKEMTQIAKKKLGYSKPTLSVSTGLLAILARVIQLFSKITGKKSEIHPVRVKKAGFPTNIKPNYLIQNGFKFNYGFEKSIEHWRSKAPEDFE